jgi:hypothetical protein
MAASADREAWEAWPDAAADSKAVAAADLAAAVPVLSQDGLRLPGPQSVMVSGTRSVAGPVLRAPVRAAVRVVSPVRDSPLIISEVPAAAGTLSAVRACHRIGAVPVSAAHT